MFYERPKKKKKVSKEDKAKIKTIEELRQRYDLDNSELTTFLEDFLDVIEEKMRTNILEANKIFIGGGSESDAPLVLPLSQYFYDIPAVDLNNSDIVGANAIVMNDECNSEQEGILFLKQGAKSKSNNKEDYETLRGYRGVLYYNNKKMVSESELYYNKGGKITIGNIACLGHLTSSQSQIIWNIPTVKRMDNISNIIIKSLTANIRHPVGEYLARNTADLSSLGTISASKATNNSMRIVFEAEKAFSTYENNVPLSVDIRSCEIEFG